MLQTISNTLSVYGESRLLSLRMAHSITSANWVVTELRATNGQVEDLTFPQAIEHLQSAITLWICLETLPNK